MAVRQLTNSNGAGVVNALLFDGTFGGVEGTFLQSYKTVIAFKPHTPSNFVILDAAAWNYSATTSRHRNLFLCEDSEATRRKLNGGEYKYADLN